MFYFVVYHLDLFERWW